MERICRRHQLQRQAKHDKRRPLLLLEHDVAHKLHGHERRQRDDLLLRCHGIEERSRKQQLESGIGHAKRAACGTAGAKLSSATSGPGKKKITLAWSVSNGATSYRVKRSTTNGGPYTVVATVSGTGYTDTGLANRATYYYVVSAVNGAGESPNSNQRSATTQ